MIFGNIFAKETESAYAVPIRDASDDTGNLCSVLSGRCTQTVLSGGRTFQSEENRNQDCNRHIKHN